MTKTAISRRQLLQGTAAVAATCAAPMINRGRFALFGASAPTYSTHAVDLVGRSLVVDMLNPMSLLDAVGGRKQTYFNHPELFEADVDRFRTSGINVFHASNGVGGSDAYLKVMRYMAEWNGFIAHNNQYLTRIDSVERLRTVKASGKMGVILGVQDSDHFRTPNDVDEFYGLGQRVSQLTYNSRNLLGNGSTERADDGLSDFGVAVVARMNEVGMAVDTGHCGERTTMDACEVSKKPVLITHSNCRAINPHPRCKSDEAIKKMAATGGVMGITGVRMFVKGSEPTTVDSVLDHYDHVAKLVGVEHVGVGSDIGIEGYDALPEDVVKRLKANYKSSYGFRDKSDIEGLDHARRTYDLTEGLIRRKYSDSDIQGILGGNFARVLDQIWKA